MKLINKTSLFTYLVALAVIIAGSAVFFNQLGKIVSNEANEKLLNEKNELCRILKTYPEMPLNFIPVGDNLEYKKVSSASGLKDVYRDTSIFSKEENEELPYRKLTFGLRLQNADYQVAISTTLLESEDLVRAIIKSILLILGTLLVSMLIINRVISRRLWKPFYQALESLKHYHIAEHRNLKFERTGTIEFDELRDAISRMTDKLSHDYLSLKDFSENASHEIQTPLAVIKNKLELLMQSPDMAEFHHKLISDAYEGVIRLSKLNQALILLTRIGNNQFAETQDVNMCSLIKNKIKFFEELLDHKKIKIETNIQGEPHLQINPGLADILVSNLLGNAIKHNIQGGRILLESTGNEIRILNTGADPQADPELFFERFRKGNNSIDSPGLGLSIVREISLLLPMKISYTYLDGMHRISLKFTD